MIRILFFILIAASCFGQAIDPIQFQGSYIKNGTFRAVYGTVDEYGDSIWLYQHVEFPETGSGIDSLKCVDDTLRVLTGGIWLKTAMDCSKTNELQTLAIDSTNRSFTLQISNGNSVKFQDREGVTSITAQPPLTGGTITGVGTIGVDTSILATKYDITLIEAGMDSIYDGNRVIQRAPVAGVTNLGASTFRQWLDWWYQKNYQQPTLTFNSITPTVVEVGTSRNYTLSGSTINPCAFTLSGGAISAPSGHSFGSATTFSTTYTHAPTTASTTTLTASQNWTMTTGSCEAGSPTTGTATASRTINNVYPILWGMSASDWSAGGVPYSSFQETTSLGVLLYKRIATESNLTGLNMFSTAGTPMYIYILIPKSWSDWTVTSIIDHNNFNVTASFTGYDVNVTSTGLVNNWTQAYRMYKLNTLTSATNFSYSYNR